MSLQIGRVTTQARGPSGRSPRTLATWVLGILLAPVLGYVAAVYGWYAALGGAVILGLGVLSRDARILPVLAIPCTLLVVRVGTTGTNLSISDLVLFLATLWALLAFRLREAPEIRPLLVLAAVYQATTLFTVLVNPYRSNMIEWFHEAFLVAGGLIVGWVVGRQGSARAALSIYVGGAVVLAVLTLGWAVLHHLQPNSPFGQKNYVGDMLAFAVLLVYARPGWVGWQGRAWRPLVLTVCLLGILASQSKQAMISLVVAVGVLLVRDRNVSRRSKAILAAIVPLGVLAYVGASRELASTNQFNSVHVRLSWLHRSLHIWHQAPWFGVGLRWWYTGRFLNAFQPPNAELEVLTSAGIVGLAGFIVLILGSCQVLRRLPHRFGTLALAILVMRVVQGQLDIFWVGGQGSLPWMVVGLGLGALALERSSVDPALGALDAVPSVAPESP